MPEKKKNYCKKTLKDISQNYWAISTIILAILLVTILLTGGITGGVIGTGETTITAKEAGEKTLTFVNSRGADAGLISVNDNNQFYEIILLINGQNVPLQITKDGKNLAQLIPLETQAQSRPSTDNTPKTPIYECTEQYGISSETIIFYYSDQCGWCSKMKPGVENLEKEGYAFKWIEGSNAEDAQLIDECIRPHMTSGGVPQFICPKTSEIHTGAFTDENRNLDQLALKNWVDNCIAN